MKSTARKHTGSANSIGLSSPGSDELSPTVLAVVWRENVVLRSSDSAVGTRDMPGVPGYIGSVLSGTPVGTSTLMMLSSRENACENDGARGPGATSSPLGRDTRGAGVSVRCAVTGDAAPREEPEELRELAAPEPFSSRWRRRLDVVLALDVALSDDCWGRKSAASGGWGLVGKRTHIRAYNT